ncbi:MAG TPA: DUF3878 family protein [Clostridiales bacterium]|jgi:hypothetical protein|nr:DUF3878 family protein [Clostridiales bacterium]
MKYHNPELEALSQLHRYFDTALNVKSRENYIYAENIPDKIQKEIRNIIKSFVEKWSDVLSNESKERLAEDMKLSNIFFYLASCHDNFINLMDEKGLAFKQATEGLDESVTKCFARLNYFLFYENDPVSLQKRDECYYLNLFDTHSAVIDLVFKDAEAENLEDLPFINYELSKEGDTYILELVQYDSESKKQSNAVLRCKEVAVEYQVFDYVASAYSKKHYSWGMLALALYELGGRYSFDERLVNEKERRFIPLSNFEPIMCHFSDDYNVFKHDDEQFDMFIGYVKRANCEKLLPALNAYREEKNEKRKKKKLKKLTQLMDTPACEPLWRLIFNELSEATAEYPKKAEVLADPELLLTTRAKIKAAMNKAGFRGEYPNYRKSNMGTLSCISFVEYYVGNELYIIINTTAAQPDRNKAYLLYERLDAYGAFFYGYGRVLPVLIHKDDTSQTDAPDLKHTLAIAIKFAEFKELDKSESQFIGISKHDGFNFANLLAILIILGIGIMMLLLNLNSKQDESDSLMAILLFFAFAGSLAVIQKPLKTAKLKNQRKKL